MDRQKRLGRSIPVAPRLIKIQKYSQVNLLAIMRHLGTTNTSYLIQIKSNLCTFLSCHNFSKAYFKNKNIEILELLLNTFVIFLEYAGPIHKMEDSVFYYLSDEEYR